MNVLLSVKPKYAEQIFNGKKKYEFRKTLFSRRDIETIFIYASSPIQRVIGEFEYDGYIWTALNDLWEKTKDESGISEELFLKYFGQKSKGYALKVKNQKKYDSPMSLDSFMISTPPQSFRYIDYGTIQGGE